MKKLISATLIVFLFLSFQLAFTADHESPQNRKASEVLPTGLLKGPHHKVDETVISYGYMNHFTVHSDFGKFEVTGNLALFKLINEINAMAVLNEIKKSDAFKDAVKKSAESPVKFGKNMIEHPVGTVTGVPKGVFSLVGNIKTSLFHHDDSVEDSTVEEVARVSACKRQYAKLVHVDVYSRNEELQKKLNSLGWACAIGGLTLSAATIPIGSPVISAVKASKLAQDVSNTIYAEPPARLRQLNEEKLLGLGIDKNIVEKFLDHPIYTPTQETIIAMTLEKLKGVNGLEGYLDFVSNSAADDHDANFITVTTLLITKYSENKTKLKEINQGGIFIVAKDVSRHVMVPFPMDYGVWSEMADKQTSKLVSDLELKKGENIDFWITGTVSPLARKNLKSKGINVEDNIAVKAINLNVKN